MPVGKGSIIRATNASSNNNKSEQSRPIHTSDLLMDIPVDQIQSVPLDWGIPNYSEQSVEELMNSIKKFGMIEPIILRRLSDGIFQLLCGNRRILAAKAAGMETVSARVMESLKDEEARSIYQELHKFIKEDNSNLHEVKFQAVSRIKNDLPSYLL